MEAAGFDFADVLARLGLYPDAPKLPAVVGYEVAGTIAAAGAGVDPGRVGEPALALTRFGGYSSRVVVPAGHAVRRPEGDPAAAATSAWTEGAVSWKNPRPMRAIRVHEHGGSDVLKLEHLPTPEPGPGQVRVRVAWAALNHLDLWVRRGIPGHQFPLPLVPGCDFSGVVDAAGAGAASLQPGLRVAVAPGFSCGQCRACCSGQHNLCRDYGIYGESADGGDAEYAVVRAENLIPVPEGFPLDLAAAFPLTYLTAWHMLVARCQVRPGDLVLVHAAGSGVSVAAVQIAKLWGARVMVTAGSDAKVRQGLENGADFGVNHRKEDWTAAARAWTARRGFDVIVDHVGADTVAKGVWLLARGGRLVSCGVTSGAEVALNFSPIFFKSLSVLGSTMGTLGEQMEVAEHVFTGRLKPVVDSCFPLERAADAHRKVEQRDVFGKVLLQVDASLA